MRKGDGQTSVYHGRPRKRRSSPAHPFTDDRRGERIQKVLAQAGVASRRECEELVAQARVRVNGIILDALPAWVNAEKDKIEVDGRVIRGADPHVYIMLYKPKGIVCTNVDPDGRRRVIDLVQHPLQTRLFPVGRLEIDASGLVLMTNDGEFANRLTHPRYEVSKTFELVVAGRLDDAAVATIEAALFPSKRSMSMDPEKRSRVTVLNRELGRTTLLMEIRDGKNTEIRLTMLRIGYPLKRLRQTAIGPLQLRGVTVGAWRELSVAEFSSLRKAAFKSVTARTRPDERGEDEFAAQPATTPAGKTFARPFEKSVAIPVVKKFTRPFAKPFARPFPKPAPQAGAKPFARPFPKPAPQAGAKPFARPFPKPAPQAGAKPFTRPFAKPAPQAGAKPFTRPFAKPAPQSGVKPAMRPVAKPFIKRITKPKRQRP